LLLSLFKIRNFIDLRRRPNPCNVTPVCVKHRLQKLAESSRSGEVKLPAHTAGPAGHVPARYLGRLASTSPWALSGSQGEIEPFFTFIDKQLETFVKTISHFKGAGFLQIYVLKPAIH